jgi:hypothetical protein
MISHTHQGRGESVSLALVDDLKTLANDLEAMCVWSAALLDEVLAKHGY